MAVDTINRLNTFTTFIEAAVDPVGREDMTRDLNSEKYDENLRSKNSVEVLSKKARAETNTCGNKFSRQFLATSNNDGAVNKKQKYNCFIIEVAAGIPGGRRTGVRP